MIDIFDDIDEVQTRLNVTRFFKKNLDRLYLLSGHSLKSPQITGLPGSHRTDRAETEIIDGIDAGAMLEAVSAALQSLPLDEMTVLIDFYIKHKTWEATKQEIHRGDKQLSKIAKQARLDFADSFSYWQRKYGIEKIYDLHAYKKDEKTEQ